VEYLRGFCEIDDLRAASKRPWNPRTAALGIAVVAVVWFTQVSIVVITGRESRWTAYLLQTAGVDAEGYEYWGSVLFAGEGVSVTVDMVMIAFVIVGAFAAAYWSGDFRLRIPKKERLPNAVAGGFLMGVGSRLAPGYSIGNIYSGIAELSVHSFIAAVSRRRSLRHHPLALPRRWVRHMTRTERGRYSRTRLRHLIPLALPSQVVFERGLDGERAVE